MELKKKDLKPYLKAHEIITKVGRHKKVTIEEFASWFLGVGKHHHEAFVNQAASLPQAKMLPDANVKAWIWSFFHDPAMMALPDDERKRYLIGACAGLRKLSAYDAAVVAQEIENPDVYSFSFKTAEGIRRSMLLIDAYAAITARPESRLRNAFRPLMNAEAWKAVHEAMRKIPGYVRTEIVESRSGDWISAHGKRYSFLKVELDPEKTEGPLEIWYPVLLVADDDETKEREYLYELGALCAAIPEGTEVGGCVISTVDTVDYVVHTKMLGKDAIEPYMDIVRRTSDTFWQDHVLGMKPMAWRQRKDRVEMDARTLDEITELGGRVAKLSIARKAIDKEEKVARKRMWTVLNNFAYKKGVAMADLAIPDMAVSAKRTMTVLKDELQYIIDKMPEAEDRVFKAIQADPELMQAKLEEIGISKDLYCVGVPDPKLVAAFCEEYGVRAPLRSSVSFQVSTKKGNQERIGAIIEELAPVFDELGIVPDDNGNGEEDE